MKINDGTTTMVLVICVTFPFSQSREGASFSTGLSGISRIASNKTHASHFDSTLIRLIFIFIFLFLRVSLALRQKLR